MTQFRDLGFRRLAGGEHFVGIEFVRENGCQGQIGVVPRFGIALQLLPAPAQTHDLPHQPQVLPNQIGDIAGIENQRALQGQRRTAFLAVLAPEIAALQWMYLLECDTAPVPAQQEQHVAGVAVGRRRPAHHRLHMLRRVISLPGILIDLFPLLPRHGGVCRGHMFEIILIQVRIQVGARAVEALVVLGAGQRCQAVKLQQINRQFALDDPDVADDRFRRVAGEAKDVAREHGRAGVLPRQQHFPVLSDFVLLLARAQQAVGVDALQPDKHARHPGPPRLFDEVRQAVAHGVHLDDELDIELLLLHAF